MNRGHMINSLVEFTRESGTTKTESPEISVKEIIEFQKYGLKDRTLGEVEIFLGKMHSYDLYLRNQASSLLAEIRMEEGRLSLELAKHWNTLPSNLYASNAVKEAMLFERFEQMGALHEHLTVLRMRYDKVKSLPASLESAIRTVQTHIKARYNGK